IDSDWNNAGNWACGAIPTTLTDVTIPSGTLNNPEIANSGMVRNVTVQIGGNLIVSGTLKVTGTIVNSGIFDTRTGTIEMAGTMAQDLPLNTFQNNTVNHLITNNSNPEGVTLGGALDILGSLTYSNTGRKLNTNDHFTLKSTSENTAWVG